MLYFLALVATVTAIILFLHWYSYRYLKSLIVGRRRWDLNICCGTTYGGGVNVDIVRHEKNTQAHGLVSITPLAMSGQPSSVMIWNSVKRLAARLPK